MTLTLTEQAAELEQRVLNAPTLAAAQRYHEQLDRVRDRMPQDEREAPKSSDYRLGYQAGWMAGRASKVKP